MAQAVIKNAIELEAIREGGKILAGILRTLVSRVKSGVTTAELDREAERLMREAGGEPSFKGYHSGGPVPFPSTICASLNEEVVHAPAVPSRTLKAGDIFKIDIGMRWPGEKLRMENATAFGGVSLMAAKNGEWRMLSDGLCTDMAVSVVVGKMSPESQRLLDTTRKALEAGIAVVRDGARVSDIGKAVEAVVKKQGYGIVRDMVGHGVGYGVHEKPEIPNFWRKGLRDNILKEGMVICIEPMVNLGTHQIGMLDDQWTMVTADKSLSAHFEHTIIVRRDHGEVVTL
ncbi:MAG: M24 family metallopeptidase [Patescibacteria group bacterium]